MELFAAVFRWIYMGYFLVFLPVATVYRIRKTEEVPRGVTLYKRILKNFAFYLLMTLILAVSGGLPPELLAPFWRIDWPILTGAVAYFSFLLAVSYFRWRKRVNPSLARISIFTPRTKPEFVWVAVVSVAAGFTEELVYRGFLWFLAWHYIGPVPGTVLCIAAFGMMHLLQGWALVVFLGLIGALFHFVAYVGGLPAAMICHAIYDLGVFFMWGTWFNKQGVPIPPDKVSLRPAPVPPVIAE